MSETTSTSTTQTPNSGELWRVRHAAGLCGACACLDQAFSFVPQVQAPCPSTQGYPKQPSLPVPQYRGTHLPTGLSYPCSRVPQRERSTPSTAPRLGNQKKAFCGVRCSWTTWTRRPEQPGHPYWTKPADAPDSYASTQDRTGRKEAVSPKDSLTSPTSLCNQPFSFPFP